MALVPKSKIKVEFETHGEKWALWVNVPRMAVLQQIREKIGADRDVMRELFAMMDKDASAKLRERIVKAQTEGKPIDGRDMLDLLPDGAMALLSSADVKPDTVVEVADIVQPLVHSLEGIGDPPMSIAELREKAEPIAVKALFEAGKKIVESCTPEAMLEAQKK